MKHPFDDLTDGELAEMVEWCQKYFSPRVDIDPCKYDSDTTCMRGEPNCEECEEWKWSKGDWIWYRGKIHVISTEPDLFFQELNIQEVVPLPLAHQWDDLVTELGYWEVEDHLQLFIVYRAVGKEPVEGEHPNPHYRRFLAFSMIEGGYQQIHHPRIRDGKIIRTKVIESGSGQ